MFFSVLRSFLQLLTLHFICVTMLGNFLVCRASAQSIAVNELKDEKVEIDRLKQEVLETATKLEKILDTLKESYGTFDLCLRNANGGDAYAMFLLANRYTSGNGVTKDLVQALAWYRRAADKGRGDAMNAIGNAYFGGLGVEVDHVRAREWFEKGSRAGDADAMIGLGIMQARGIGGPVAATDSFLQFRQAVQLGNLRATPWLADCYFHGLGVKSNVEQARRFYLMGFDAGRLQPEQIHNLARMLEIGLGGDVDPTKALVCLEKCIQLGFTPAYGKLADVWIKRGHEVHGKAMLLRGVDAAEPVAFRLMGELAEAGKLFPKDSDKAKHWYRKAAHAGDAEATNMLAVLHMKNSPRTPDIEIRAWLKLAIANGNCCSMYVQGMIHEYGLMGEGKDSRQAQVFYLQAAEAGCSMAKDRLKDSKTGE